MDYGYHVPGFTKLFSGLIHSTVWREEMHVKVVWITMLAMADKNGHVLASMPGLADAARVSMEQCEEALGRLAAPDKHSRTKTNQGRRISEIDGGWAILNYAKYRAHRDTEARREQVREAVSRYRERKRAVINVSHGEPRLSQAEAEAEAENGRKEEPPAYPPALPPADAAERAIKASTDALRTRLYALVSAAVEADPKHRDPTELMRLFTSYTKGDKQVGGVVNAALLTHERLEKSIADAEWHLEEWSKANGA